MILGRTHNNDYFLFKLDKKISKEVIEFIDKRQTEGLETESNYDSIFSDFIIPSIKSGTGFNFGKFTLDNEHPLVSLVTNIVPSPDWFVGVDSFMVRNDNFFYHFIVKQIYDNFN